MVTKIITNGGVKSVIERVTRLEDDMKEMKTDTGKLKDEMADMEKRFVEQITRLETIVKKLDDLAGCTVLVERRKK